MSLPLTVQDLPCGNIRRKKVEVWTSSPTSTPLLHPASHIAIFVAYIFFSTASLFLVELDYASKKIAVEEKFKRKFWVKAPKSRIFLENL